MFADGEPMTAFEVTVERLVYGGEGLARYDGQVVLVSHVAPGDRVLVEPFQAKKGLVRARVVKLLEPSEARTEPPCIYFAQCGGCQLQHLKYEDQLRVKTEVVKEQLARIGGLTTTVLDTIPSPLPFGYRNHARFSVDRAGHLGFTRFRTHSLVPIDRCLLMLEPINRVLLAAQSRLRGVFQLSVRYSENTGQLLVNPRVPYLDARGIATGQPYYEEGLLGRAYRISASSFFQVNTRAAELLAAKVVEFLQLKGHETVLDAYSGVGTFSLLIAEKAGRVIGVEESPSAVEDAIFNARGMGNVRFVLGKVEAVLPTIRETIDAVVLDPARVGCAPEVLEALRSKRPGRVVYVSCDPATLARDLGILTSGGMYRLVQVQPLDMFPQTYHVEAVALLELA